MNYQADLNKEFTITRRADHCGSVIDEFDGYIVVDEKQIPHMPMFAKSSDEVFVDGKCFQIKDWGVTTCGFNDSDSVVVGFHVTAARYPQFDEMGFYGLI